MVGFGVTRVHLFILITNVEVCQVIEQIKIALTLVQKGPCKNEVIALRNKRIHKIPCYESHFMSIPKTFTPKM